MTYLHKLAKRLAAAGLTRLSTDVAPVARSRRPSNPHLPYKSVETRHLRPWRASTPLWLLTVAAVACESPVGGPTTTVQQVIVRPSRVTTAPGQRTQFYSLGLTPAGDTLSLPATWYATGGTISASGEYVASDTPGNYIVTASDEQRLWLNDTAQVEIGASAPIDFRLVISPAQVTVAALDSVDFAAFGVTTGGDTLSVTVQWSTSEGSIRTQGPQRGRGTFKPGRHSRTQRVIVEDSTGTRVDSATVTVTGLPAASVALQPNPVTLRVGTAAQVAATARDSSGAVIDGKLFQWTTGNPAIATVSATGLVSGLSSGTTTVAATADGAAGSAAVTVMTVPVGSVAVTPSSASVNAGATVQLSATVRDSAGNVLTGRVVTWTTSQPAVATVSGSGLVSGAAPGTASITATCEGKTAAATITVTQAPVATVVVAPASASVLIGGTTQLSATLRDAQGNVLSGRSVTWSSSATGIATVNGTGLVTAVALGTATITATSEGKSGTAAITVTATPVATVTVVPGSASIVAGATTQLAAQLRDSAGNLLSGRTVTWTTGQASIATVNASGLVTGVAPGNVTITATSEGKSGTAAITVTAPPVATVTVVPGSTSVVVGATTQLAAQLRDSAGNLLTGRTVTWSSGQTAIATVNGTGLVTGRGAGSATITATSEGKSGSATVTVTLAPVATVTIVPSSANVTVGGTTQLTAELRDASGNTLTGRTVTWTSGNAAVATVGSAGLVTGVATGSTSITATSEGTSGSATVTVSSAPPPGAVPDPMALPDAVGQVAQTAAYNALSVAAQPAGFSYTDPTTGVKVWKVTSASLPSSNSGMSNDYTDAGQRISQPWQSGGQTYWTIIAYAAFNGSEYWLVDFNKTTGFSNWRHLTGQLRPDIDLCFSFSNNPATPRIAYVINGGSIRRIDTQTMTVANTGNFPHAGATTWLQVDRNDAWFVVQSSSGHTAWNSQTNVEYRNTLSFDEARLERDGNYAFLTNVNGGRRWNLADNTVTNNQNWGTTYWAAHMADVRGYWSTVDGYNTSPLGLDVYYPNPAGDPNNGIGIYQDTYTGTMAGLTHHSGNWIQDVNDRTQWAFMEDDGASPPAGKLRNGIAAYRLDGAAFKLVAHHYSTATDYYKEPWAVPSPDGRLVLFASDMGVRGGRTDLFLIEMPLR
jgi:uncharacterized protein YjdB